LLLCTAVVYGQKDYSVSFSQPKEDVYQLNFDITHWDVQSVSHDGVQYQQIMFSRSTVTMEKGWAELPFVTASVQLPAQKNVDLNVIYTEYTDIQMDDPLLPSRGAISRNQDPATIPYQIDPQSLVNVFYPETISVAEEPYIIRDVRGTTVTVYPFQWNAVTQTLRIYTKMTVTLTENNQPATNPLLKENSNPIREMRGMYKSIFINYVEPRIPLTMAEYGDILVITTSRDEDAIQPYIDWKREKGYNVEKEVVATGTNVKTLIKDKYDANENLMYVLLVGGWNEIKSDMVSCWLGSGPTDPMLGDVVGNASDYRPDISIGRMSANNSAQVTVQVNKAIQYERNPNMDAGWYEAFIGIGSNLGPGDDGETDMLHIQRIYTERLQTPIFTYNTHYQNYGSNPPASTLVGHVNAGASTMAYCGHGSETSWGTTGFSNSHISTLTNGEKLPFIVSVACVNGAFHNSYDCFAEAWLKKENGGAVVTWMSSISQPWNEPMRGQDYFYDILSGGFDYSQYPGQNGINTDEQRTHWGSIAVNAANLMLSESPGTDDKYTVRTWTTFGDPNLQLRTKLPDVIISSNHDIAPAFNYETTITTNGAPVEDALVCLSQNDVFVKGFTDESGNIVLEHPFTEGDVLLVVTAFNTTTIYETLSVGEAPELFPPQNLTYIVEKANHVVLSWDAPEGGKSLTVTGYNVYRNSKLINTDPVRDALTYTDIVPQNGEYKYYVTALYDEAGTMESGPSNTVTVTIDGMCMPFGSDISLEQVEDYSILVSWEAPQYEGTELVGYNVYRDTEQINTEIVTELSYLDKDLDPETTYCYQVEVVYNDCEETLMSNEACLTVQPPISINEPAGQTFQIFPNPVHGTVNITGDIVPTNVRIYNITGQLMYETETCTKDMSISVLTMPAGIYFIKIDIDNGSITQKLIFK
jgi:gingipain R